MESLQTSTNTTTTDNTINQPPPTFYPFDTCTQPLAFPNLAVTVKRRYRRRKVLSEVQLVAKRDAFLSRNREAAHKSRSKKRDWENDLAKDATAAEVRYGTLNDEYTGLTKEVMLLKRQLAHFDANAQCLYNKSRKYERVVATWNRSAFRAGDDMI
jgi:hypothetical protein